MIEAETETAEIPIKKTAQVVLAMGSTSVPGSLLTPMGQDSCPCSIASRSFRQNSSSCSRPESLSSSTSIAALFHLNMTLSLISHSRRSALIRAWNFF